MGQLDGSLAPPQTQPRSRVLSVDVLRGFVMFTMVFVNDAYGAKGMPWWLKHWDDLPKSFGPSGMTFVDVVFPAFLFIVGLSIPVAVEGRRAKGEGWLWIFGHILLRTVFLIFIGVLMVESPSHEQMGWPDGLWQGLMLGGVILAFHSLPLKRPALRYTSLGVRILGGLLLIFLAFKFRDDRGGHIEPSWWGILGLIGWAYFAASTCYLLLRNEDRAMLVGVVGLLMAIYFAQHAGAFRWADKCFLRIAGHKIGPLSLVNFGETMGSHAAITMSGVVIGSMLLPASPLSPIAKIRFAGVFTLLLVLAALLTTKNFGINKNNATPAWCFWSAAITTALWIGLYALIDVAGIRRWAIPFAWAGASALFIYVLADVWDVLNEHVINWPWYDHLGRHYPQVIYHKLITAAGLSIFAGVLGRIGFRLRL